MKLADICELIVDCEHKTAPTQGTGYPSIRTPNIGRGYFLLDGVNRVSEETYQIWTRRVVPQYGDLIMAREAPVGNVAMIPYGLKPCLGQRTLLIRPNLAKVHPRYLTYLLVGDEIQGVIRGLTNGATVPHLNMKDVRSLSLPSLPDLPTQRKIAGILSAYDDLIENNTRRIALLEAMAQAIYREWFVHFRFPGHENVSRVDSPLGMIPEGWKVQPLKEVYRTSSGGTPSRKVNEYYDGGSINWVKTKELNDRFIWETEEKITEAGLANSSAKVFPAYSVIMAMYGATIGQLGILGVEATTNQACCGFLTTESQYGYPYLFLNLLTNRTDIINLRAGAAQQNVSQDVIREIPFTVPPLPIVQDFNKLVEPFLQGMLRFQKKNVNLTRTRDLLLPKLISGQLDVEALDMDIENIPL